MLSINSIPFSTRAHWMRVANAAVAELESPCPTSPFATVIVNHTAPGLGELICMGVNSIRTTGNPTMHGACSETFFSLPILHTDSGTLCRRDRRNRQLHFDHDGSAGAIQLHPESSAGGLHGPQPLYERGELSYGKSTSDIAFDGLS